MARYCRHRRSNRPRNAAAATFAFRPARGVAPFPTAGFTLVEVLIALAVLAIALAAVLRAMGQAIDLTTDLRDRTEALWVAEDRVVEHQVMRDWPALDTKEGTLEFGGRQWRWRERVSAFLNFEDLRKLEVEVSKAGSPDVLAHLSVFLRRPTP